MRSLILCTLVLLAGALAADELKSQYITLDNTKLLAKPAAFSKTMKTLKKGMLVKVGKAKNGYVQATLPMGDDSVTGYLPVRALQDKRPSMTANAKKSGDASAEEVAAATKGFNKQIESDMRASSTGDGYKRLDKAIERTTVEDPAGQTETFREKGKIGEFKEDK
jgi:hypothetical protein